MTNAPPSIDPADTDGLAGTLRAVMGKMMQSVDDMLPARVVSYDRASNRATVQPLMMMVTTADERISRAQVSSVPVFTLGGGGFLISFPIQPGDLGWLKASDRDTSLFLQSLDEDAPNTKRMHSFQDGVFFPDIMRQWALASVDASSMVIQSASGNVRVSLGANTLMLTAPTVIVDAALMQVTGDVTAAGVSLKTHVHTGVSSGASMSGPPVL